MRTIGQENPPESLAPNKRQVCGIVHWGQSLSAVAFFNANEDLRRRRNLRTNRVTGSLLRADCRKDSGPISCWVERRSRALKTFRGIAADDETLITPGKDRNRIMEITDWMNQTKASEIMVELLVTLSPADTLAMAAETLLAEQISGAPVLDSENRCVGVLSISDLIRAEGKVLAEQQQIAESSFFSSGIAWPDNVYQQKLENLRDKILPVSEQAVQRFMTSDIVSVAVGDPLATVLEYMINAHVHRVLVLDSNVHLQGIISTIDVLAALKRAS
jgi:CBS domain-containing protein